MNTASSPRADRLFRAAFVASLLANAAPPAAGRICGLLVIRRIRPS